MYFLLVLTDARKLRSKMRFEASGLAALMAEDDPRLITSDYPAWMAHPFTAQAGGGGSDDIPFRQDKIEYPGSDGLAG